MNLNISIYENKEISFNEYAHLMQSVGFGEEFAYSPCVVAQSISSYPFVAHARTKDDELIGYVSAFSDQAFSTLIGELAVHPSYQRQGIGRRLVTAVENYAGKVPVYVNPFKDTEEFFINQGFKQATRPIVALFKAA